MASNIAPAINKVVSSLKSMGIFKKVQTVEPKGATFTGLSVRPQAGRWVAECVVDV